MKLSFSTIYYSFIGSIAILFMGIFRIEYSILPSLALIIGFLFMMITLFFPVRHFISIVSDFIIQIKGSYAK